MALTDRFDLPLAAASELAVAEYVEALDLLLSANTGAAARLERVLAADPDFALAHIAHARLLQLQARSGEARAAAERAKSLAARASVREQRHVAVVALAIGGDAPRALAAVR
jgi:lipopolysaccharide biosynthesis regulator YciM